MSQSQRPGGPTDSRYCPNCGALVSSQADSCPRCGQRLRRTSPWLVLLVALIVAAIGAGVALAVSDNGSHTSDTQAHTVKTTQTAPTTTTGSTTNIKITTPTTTVTAPAKTVTVPSSETTPSPPTTDTSGAGAKP